MKWTLKEPLYIKKSDKRYALFKKQLKTKGFCDAETWSLDSCISAFILPRLQRFREIAAGHPYGISEKEWNTILDKMIFAHEWSLNHEEDKYDHLTQKERDANWDKYQEGITLFAEHFRQLWW